jgi:hypothetical protein
VSHKSNRRTWLPELSRQIEVSAQPQLLRNFVPYSFNLGT